MDDYTKRQWLKTAYPGDTWSKRVDKMPTAQVTALYLKFEREGRFKR